MKKLIVLLCALFVVGCSSAVETNDQSQNNNGGGTSVETNVEVVGTISDFFPFEENVMFTIAGVDSPEGISALDQRIFTTIVNGDRIQQRIMAPSIDNTVVLDRSGGSLTQEFIFQDFYRFEDVTNEPSNMGLVILQEPLALGHSWDNGFEEHPGVSTITNTFVSVTTPAGTFTDTIEVTTEFANGDMSVTYFAIGVGQIRDSYSTAIVDLEGNSTPIGLTTELVSITQGPMLDTLYVFSPDDNLMALEMDTAEIELNTNQNFVQLFNDVLPDILNENFTINTVEVDRAKSLVHVDFASDFSDINFGASYETLFLDALANTFGYFFRAENFRITIDGANYTSGHFEFADGEFITVGDNE